eukprot:208036-Chlamydomonas_euryale.AAC.1
MAPVRQNAAMLHPSPLYGERSAAQRGCKHGRVQASPHQAAPTMGVKFRASANVAKSPSVQVP